MINDELLTADKNGITVGKNLEVDGTTKLNGGLKPIHTYKLDGITNLYVYFEGTDHDSSVSDDFLAYGWIERFGNGRPCIFYYALENGNVSVFKGLSNDTIYEYSNNTMQTFKIAKAEQCQSKLYRHIIYLSGTDSNSNTYSGYIIVESPSNLEVSTSQDLTTLLKPTDGFEYPLSGVVYKQNIDYVTELVPIQVIQFESSNWKFYSTDNQADISTFRDTVTAL